MISDDAVAEFLSGEMGDERFVFACQGAVYVWVPSRRYVQGVFVRDALGSVLVGYLARQGRVFGTMEQAVEYYSANAALNAGRRSGRRGR